MTPKPLHRVIEQGNCEITFVTLSKTVMDIMTQIPRRVQQIDDLHVESWNEDSDNWYTDSSAQNRYTGPIWGLVQPEISWNYQQWTSRKSGLTVWREAQWLHSCTSCSFWNMQSSASDIWWHKVQAAHLGAFRVANAYYKEGLDITAPDRF